MTIKTNTELYAELGSIVKNAMKDVSKDLADNLAKKIWSEFYQQYSPIFYIRTYQLLNSATSTVIKETPTSITVQIFIDYSKLKYFQYSGKEFPGESVADMARKGIHGHLYPGGPPIQRSGRFWDSFVREFNQAKIESMLNSKLHLK